MLKFIGKRASEVQYFCSKICYDLFAEMTPSTFVTEPCDKKMLGILEQGFKMTEEPTDIMPREISPDEEPYKVHLQSSKLDDMTIGSICKSNTFTVATQTDETQIQCSCKKENVRQILIPIKRMAKNTNKAPNTLDQIVIQRTKVARRL